MSNKLQWSVWLIITLGLISYLTYSLISPPSPAAATFLPGQTTHGHYQIELQCRECHTPGMGVQRDACIRCHGEELKQATDTHPRSKFTDPSKAHLVRELDGRSCITCHREHVPEQTLAMGLSLPGDYCWHCHQEIGEQRPSHQDLAYDSCATAGCHNYHDNRALFEDFLVSHYQEPDLLDEPLVPARTQLASLAAKDGRTLVPLTIDEQDSPTSVQTEETLLTDWATTAHAAAGVNCTACHIDNKGDWSDQLTHTACTACHQTQVATFLAGRHGMRLSVGLSPMTPKQARLPMKHSSFHHELTCTACHEDHRFDTQYAATEACLKCHNDSHSLAYQESLHYDAWQQELAGDAPAGSGVSCATCHMPREEGAEGKTFVQHNQNNNLRPNDKMVRTVCGHCHGLQFTLDALADRTLIENNFQGQPSGHVQSIEMAHAWAEEAARKREEREQRRQAKNVDKASAATSSSD